MALNEKNIEALTGSQETFEQLVRERLRQAVRLTLMSVLEEEVTAIIGAERYVNGCHRGVISAMGTPRVICKQV